jgi:hypothetical protein
LVLIIDAAIIRALSNFGQQIPHTNYMLEKLTVRQCALREQPSWARVEWKGVEIDAVGRLFDSHSHLGLGTGDITRSWRIHSSSTVFCAGYAGDRCASRAQILMSVISQ